MGSGNEASGRFSSGFGYGNGAIGENSSAFGNSNTASNTHANAFGYDNEASGVDASAFGITNMVTGSNAVAMGNYNDVLNDNASAFGINNSVSGSYASTFGYGNIAKGERASAVGSSNNADAAGSSAVGVNNSAEGVDANAFGNNNIAKGDYSSAFGVNNSTAGQQSSAVGYDNLAYGDRASVFGYKNIAAAADGVALGGSNIVTGAKATAVGTNNKVKGSSSAAVGTDNIVDAELAAVMGNENKLYANNSAALGNGNIITGNATNGLALGNNTIVALADSVALGSGSVVFEIHDVTGNSAYTQWAGVSDVRGAVSVGAPGAARQLQNVAAGRVSADSTDAVNGSQLYQVQQQVAAQEVTVQEGDSNIVIESKPGSNGGTDYEVKLGDKLDVGDNGNMVIDGTGDGKIDVGKGKVVLDGEDGSVKAGGVTINKDNEGTVDGLTNKDWDPDNITSGRAATEDQLKAIHDKASEAAEKAGQYSSVSNGDNNLIIDNTGKNESGGIDHQVRLNDVVEIGSGSNKVSIDGNNGKVGGLANTTWDADNYASGQAATEDQLKAVHDSAAKYDVDSSGKLNKNKITLEGNGGTKIGNVAAGEVSATSMDAVNGSQLYQVQQEIGNISHDITRLGDEIDSVGALSAAMAGLHPRFQDGNKGELAMAYGGYGGKSALAVGGFYAPNEKVMFSLGMGISEGGSKMGNFGINFALDRSKDRKKEPRDIVYTRKEVDQLLAARNGDMEKMMTQMKLQQTLLEEQRLLLEEQRAELQRMRAERG